MTDYKAKAQGIWDEFQESGKALNYKDEIITFTQKVLEDSVQEAVANQYFISQTTINQLRHDNEKLLRQNAKAGMMEEYQESRIKNLKAEIGRYKFNETLYDKELKKLKGLQEENAKLKGRLIEINRLEEAEKSELLHRCELAEMENKKWDKCCRNHKKELVDLRESHVSLTEMLGIQTAEKEALEDALKELHKDLSQERKRNHDYKILIDSLEAVLKQKHDLLKESSSIVSQHKELWRAAKDWYQVTQIHAHSPFVSDAARDYHKQALRDVCRDLFSEEN